MSAKTAEPSIGRSQNERRLRAAVYARVSTFDKGQDPAMQIREMQEFCGRRAWDPDIFADSGFSGSKVSRPELDRMMALCRRRKYDVVVVYRFDRFARSTKFLVDALSEFESLGIQFVSIHENCDTTTPQGKLLFHICAAIAEFERELTRERVRSGIAHARARGVKLGRRRCIVDVVRISSLRERGASWEEVGRKIGVSAATAKRAFLIRQKPLSELAQ